MAKRGSVITLPESWLVQCREWREQEKLSLEAAGILLARTVRRSRPFAISTVRRYLLGELLTDELTKAFAKEMGVPYPVQVHESENHQQWCELGVRLDKVDEAAFSNELRRLEHVVSALEELAQLRDE